jgi:hypothetical protein
MAEKFVSPIDERIRRQFVDSPQLLAFLEANFIGSVNAAALNALLLNADESAFSLPHWVEALCTLRNWLNARGLEMSLEDEIGYVSCAVEAAGAGANLSYLPALVDEMLQAYGCERAVKKG